VPRPQALAFDAAGRLWIVHERSKLSFLRDDGNLAPVNVQLGDARALAFGPNGQLFVADHGAGQVKIFDVKASKSKASVKLARILGQAAQPGDRAADRFFKLRGVAVDKDGNIVTIQVEPISGARLARWTPDGKLLWEHWGAEFVSLGNYGAHDPDKFISVTSHLYSLNRATGSNAYLSQMESLNGKFYSDPHGTPRLLKLGEAEFYFKPTGDGVQVFRIVGKTLRPAAMLGGKDPSPEGERHGQKLGQWSWHDADGDGQIEAEEFAWFKQPGEGKYGTFGMKVDERGDLWFCNQQGGGIWRIPRSAFDAKGNPTYDWNEAREIIPRDASPLKFQPNAVQPAPDGSLYAFGWSAPWPSPKNNPFWMGGSTLVRFDKDGHRLWAVGLPKTCVGLDTIPGGAGGCMVGVGDGAHILHYSADGLLLGEMAPGEAMSKQSGWMDNQCSVAVNRDPRDGLRDVFAEDDYVLRIGWYRVDDRDVQTLAGELKVR